MKFAGRELKHPGDSDVKMGLEAVGLTDVYSGARTSLLGWKLSL